MTTLLFISAFLVDDSRRDSAAILSAVAALTEKVTSIEGKGVSTNREVATCKCKFYPPPKN